jgi:iron(III) transport system substrate-binding protein
MIDPLSLSRRRFLATATAACVLGAPLATPCEADAQADAMNKLIAAAKGEGTVVVDGPPIDATREALTKGFEKAYGIPVAYISSGSSQSAARVRAERAAGKYLLDVLISGSDTPVMTFMPNGWLDRVEPILVAPDVIDRRKWKDGHLLFEDDQHTILRVLQFVTPELAINTKLVKPSEVRTWKSLLDPKWQGKMIAKDPSVSGAGASLTSYFYLTFGPDFVKKLYKDQKPTLSRDARQAAQWLAQGNYPILIGPDTTLVVQFQRLGYPVLPVFPTDGPAVLSGGYGLVSLINKAPHPSAAKLFINWLAGKEGQTVFCESILGVSLRNDITYTSIPDYMFPQNHQKYLDTYNYKFVTEQRDPALGKARELLGL